MSGTIVLTQADTPTAPSAGQTALSFPATALNQLKWVDGDGGTNILEFPSGGGTVTIPSADTLVTLTGTQTLTNKTLVTPVLGVATATSINGLGLVGSGFTLTVDGTGTAARTNAANVFTEGQTINSPAAGTVVLSVNSAASATAAVQNWRYNSSTRVLMYLQAARNYMEFNSFDAGADWGSQVRVGRNSNASTPAAGFIGMEDKSATYYFIWPDDSGVLRINTSNPTNANDTAGTVVGTQTSTLASKNILGEGVSPADALATILATPVKRYTYKSGAYNSSEFQGIVADHSPEFAMDNGRSFSPVSAFGYTVQAIKALTERIIALEA